MKEFIKEIGYLLLKLAGYSGVIVILTGLYFFENIRGYYRFKELCDIEKPKQVIGKVDPNQGWQFESINRGNLVTSAWLVNRIASLPNVKYVRFKDYEDHQTYDMRYIGGHPTLKSSYEIKPADITLQPRYLWRQIVNEEFPNELRSGRSGDQIIDLSTNKVVVNFTHIYYGTFDQNKTLLAAPSGNTCSWHTTYLGSDLNKEQIFGKSTDLRKN